VKTMKILRVPLVIVLVAVACRAFKASAQTETVLYSFAGSPNDGSEPQAGLVLGNDGNFYGTTYSGGSYSSGAVFRISPSGTYSNLYSFGGISNDGSQPQAALVQGSDGNFYGTTYGGGANGEGTVFQITPNGNETTLYSFGGYDGDGVNPQAALVRGSDGNFYGTTGSGGMSDSGGIVFSVSPSGNESVLYSFCSEELCCVDGAAGFCGDGDSPFAGLVQGNDGSFYGTTEAGGAYNDGTVFQISPSGNYVVLHSFAGIPDGMSPYGGLVQGSDGNFYGTTVSGGAGTSCYTGLETNYPFYGCGTVFRISPSGGYTVLYSFGSSPTDGAAPFAGLVKGNDGNFYGTTLSTWFRISPSGKESTLYHGVGSSGALVQGTDGNFYGTTVYGGTSPNCPSGCGTVFKLTVGGGGGGGGGSGGTNCTYALSASSVTLAAKGGSKTVKVKVKGDNCSWTASTTNDWITISSSGSYTGSGTVRYTVPGNTNTTGLIGTMTIADQTFTVNQAPGGCTFKLSPKSKKFKAAGGPGTVMVKPNFSDCEWTATSTNDWITITAGDSGEGKGTVTYSVPANTSTNVLTGTITVAGETFTVTQAGTK
jgi:uncharacterized repeat protein (TIGR03803 family)